MLRQSTHAFTTSAAAAELVDQAFGDRRLAKMALTRFAGGLLEARTRYAAEASPPLLVVEAASDQGPPAAELDALAEVCVSGTNLIVLGAVNDVTLYRDLLRRGVADYLVLPASPMRLIEAVLDLYRDPGKRPVGQVIAFLGAKGGAGSTTMACNVGYRLAQTGNADVVVVDLDLPFGGADLAFNVEATYGIHSVLGDPERVDETFLQRAAARYGEGLNLLVAPATLDVDASVSSAALSLVVTALSQQARYVVLDLPRVWSEWVRQALNTADQVVITAVPDLASVRNARNLIDLLAARRALDRPPTLVLNRVGAARRGEVTARDFATTVGLEPTVTIREEGAVFGLAAGQGKMVEEVNRRSRAAEAIRQLADRIGGPVARPPGSPGTGWLRRLTGKG